MAGSPLVIPIPLNYQNFIEAISATGYKRGIQPYQQREVISIPASSSYILTLYVPDNKALVTLSHTLSANPTSSQFLVTGAYDNQQLFYQIPLNQNLPVIGAFIPPVEFAIEYVIVNNSTSTTEFTADLQMIEVDKRIWDDQIRPILDEMFNVVLSKNTSNALKEAAK